MNQGPDRNPAVVAAIERAKGFERRRCGHLMDEAARPERECMMSVVDPKGDGRNKWRYIVMTQDEELVCLFLFALGLVLGTVANWVCRGQNSGRWCRRR